MARRDRGLVIRAIDRATAVLRLTQRRINALLAPLQRLQARFARLARVAGLDRLAAGFGRVGNSINKVASEAGRAFGGIAKAAGVAAVAVTGFVVAQSAAGDELGKSAARVGLSVDAYAQLSSAAEDAGIEQQEFTSSIDTFNKSLGQAKLGKGKLASFLKSVSPGLLAELKAAKGTGPALDVVFKAMDRIKDTGKKAALSTAAFGGTGNKMTQLLADGLPALIATRKEYERVFGSQERFVKNASAFDDQLDGLKKTVGGVARDVATELFPAFGELAERLSKWLLENKEEIKAWAKVAGERLMRFARDLPGNLARISAKFDEMKAKLQPLADQFGGFGNLLAVVAGAIVFGPIIGALASLATAFITLGVAITTTPFGLILGALAAIAGAVYLVYRNWEPISKFFTDLWAGIKETFQGWVDFLGGVFTLDLERIADGIVNIFKGPIEAAKELLKFSPSRIVGRLGAAAGNALPGKNPIGTVGEDGVPNMLRRPTLSVEALRPRQQAQAQTNFVERTNNAKVEIDLTGVPRGAKVKPSRRNTADVTLNVGYVPELFRS